MAYIIVFFFAILVGSYNFVLSIDEAKYLDKRKYEVLADSMIKHQLAAISLCEREASNYCKIYVHSNSVNRYTLDVIPYEQFLSVAERNSLLLQDKAFISVYQQGRIITYLNHEYLLAKQIDSAVLFKYIHEKMNTASTGVGFYQVMPNGTSLIRMMNGKIVFRLGTLSEVSLNRGYSDITSGSLLLLH